MKIGSSVSTQEAVVETTGSEIIRQEPSWGSLVCCPKTGYRGQILTSKADSWEQDRENPLLDVSVPFIMLGDGEQGIKAFPTPLHT